MTRHCPNADCPGLARDGVVPEFVDSLERCLDCGERLIPGPAFPEPPPPLEYHDLRTVFIASDVVQGHVVASAMRAEGLYVHLKGESLAGAVGELATTVQLVEVQVPLQDEERGREIALRFEPVGRGGPTDPGARSD